VDIGFDRLGTAAGSAVVMGVLFLAPSPMSVLLALAAASAGLAVSLAPRFDRGYVRALKQSLRTRVIILDAGDVVDATTRQAVTAIDGAPAPIAPVMNEEVPGRAAAPPPGLADPLLEAAADLRSRDPRRIQRVLDAGADLDSSLISDVIPLLGRDDLFGSAVRSLRKAAPRCTGQLIDALLDPGQEGVVRRRIPRVLRATPTQRAADGLLLGLRDERLDVRYRCVQALVRMKEANPDLAIPKQEGVTAALREIAVGIHPGRGLDHVFAILSLVLEKELEIALRALRSGDAALRGTALEYLDNVLPDAVRKVLWPHLGSPGPLPPSGRSQEELRDDLLRSTVASRRSGLKRRLDTEG
jgi:HEAT repeat protein